MKQTTNNITQDLTGISQADFYKNRIFITHDTTWIVCKLRKKTGFADQICYAYITVQWSLTTWCFIYGDWCYGKKSDIFTGETWLYSLRGKKKKLMIFCHSSAAVAVTRLQSMNTEWCSNGNEIVIDLIWELAVRQIRINDQARFVSYISAYSSGIMLT